jgi:N-acetyl-anhydromuramyl-L-alanine amidase AmpD
MLSGQYESDYVRGIRLFHYLIDRNGDIYSIISKLYKVFHSSSGAHDEFTIGIEMVNPAMENQGEYTREQYTSLLSLIDYIRLECNIKTIAGHGATKAKYSSGYKSCPGQFNWAFLEQNYKLNKIQTETYEIIS